jgi:hypothetical protein
VIHRGGLILALVLAVVAGDGCSAAAPSASGAPIATSWTVEGFGPAQRAGSAYKNVDPEYRRESPRS